MANNQSVRRHLDAFTRGRIIGKLEEGRSVTSVAAEFGIARSIVSRLWRQFQTTGTAIRGFSSGRPRGTTPADDRYIVLEARRNRRQTARKSPETRHRRLDDRYRVLPWPEDCTVVVCLHDALYGVYLQRLPIGEGVLCGAGNTGIEETMNGDEYSLQMRADSV
ncbi:transposable element Tc1 transposase [Trichonephila clavipes]|nr:transposable element Tc1 transposase [Trichonephila clavipes]